MEDAMFDPKQLDAIRRALQAWERTELAAFHARRPERRKSFTTLSGREIKGLYTPADLERFDYADKLGFPGQYPFTRGPYPTMYRAQPWTMRQIAGFGTAAATNARFKFLIAQGQTGLSVDFDMPTLMGYDSDDPRALGEVGREGVAVDTLADLEELFAGIDPGSISVSMTINPTAWILLAMYVALAEKRGIPLEQLSGTIQNDIIKEFTAQKEWIYPVKPSLRIVRDSIVYSVRHLPHYNPVNVSGYHIREAGSTAVQEAAFTLAAGLAYVEEVGKTGLDVDAFAPRLSFYFISHSDFFEEIAKFRAARRVWAKIMKERFGAKKPESMRLRFHCQTAGSSLTAVQPLNNVIRTAYQAMAAVLGGCQSLHTNGMDEALAIPSEGAMKLALRTQQILLEETGVAHSIDPLGGSYLVEALTDQTEREIWAYLERIDAMGGTVAALERNFFQQEIADSAYSYQVAKERGEKTVVGVNMFREEEPEEPAIPLHSVDPRTEKTQKDRLARVKRERDSARVRKLLDELKEVARTEENLMPITIECVRAYATEGEIVNALKEIFGRYHEPIVF
ncbi:MAG: methylmalonyl-CoA mutase family protein [Candidatus Rokubacteria bacterium]|nr:methylmalonyl-CoA mutase family protein [Candidatus Rokubacteria bacterium]MBI2555548.1 methylmalonyl-CoA mutase family protein [Candidatus Rokubacteria bacterium]